MDKPTALELALVAAVIDPALAKTEPHKAVKIASELIRAAKYHIDWPFTGAAERLTREKMAELDAEAEKWNPAVERMSLANAWKRFGQRYKTLSGFVDALREENLIVFTDGEAVTCERAVCELLRRQAERKHKADRERKKQAQEKRSKNRHRNSKPKKRNSARKKRKSGG
jgi:hypothetical protein